MGRIYARRADLSPDGRHMIYFVQKGRRGSWTAISRAPYLKAITFYPWGDCWNGGGLFRDNRSYWLNVGPAVADAARRRMCRWDDPRKCWEHPDLRRVDDVRTLAPANNECLGVYFSRLIRDGWHWARTGDRTAQTPEVFEKPLRRGWRLRKIAQSGGDEPGQGLYWDRHVLLAPDSETFDRPDWPWAEREGNDIVYAEAGRLWRQKVGKNGRLAEPVLVYDFNGEKFVNCEAPH